MQYDQHEARALARQFRALSRRSRLDALLSARGYVEEFVEPEAWAVYYAAIDDLIRKERAK